jgi:NADH:ubiquinone oxidoreductase subunit C
LWINGNFSRGTSLWKLWVYSRRRDRLGKFKRCVCSIKKNDEKNNLLTNVVRVCQPSVVVYNFHSMFFHKRIFIFSQQNHNIFNNKIQNSFYSLNSISELFPAGNWLERENSELHGINFLGKKDLRNLMLQYGDSSAPFRKSYPSIGLKEVVFDSVTDTLIQVPVSTQL